MLRKEKAAKMKNIQTLSEWIYRLAVVNIYFLFGTLLGGVIFGGGPAAAAMYGTLSRYLEEETKESSWKIFWSFYKKYFFRANGLFLTAAVLGAVLFMNFYVSFRLEGLPGSMLLGINFFLLIMYLIFVFYALPILAYKNYSAVHAAMYSFIYAFSTPVVTAAAAGSIVIVHYILFLFPVLYLFFIASLPGLLITSVTIHAADLPRLKKAKQHI
jgi:uncharacterized membrane protein YesL